MLVIKEFETRGSMDWRMNCTNLKLLPKCCDAVSLHNYRPISLIGGVYMIVSKLLVEIIKKYVLDYR